jgi:hypothetical protein
LREYIENLRNILRTCWEHNGNIVGKREEQQKSKKRENLLQGEKLGLLGACCITSLAERNFHT